MRVRATVCASTYVYVCVCVGVYLNFWFVAPAPQNQYIHNIHTYVPMYVPSVCTLFMLFGEGFGLYTFYRVSNKYVTKLFV